MATSTPRRHPRKSQQTANRYPFRLTLLDTETNAPLVTNIPCAYEAEAANNESGALEDEERTQDRLRVSRWLNEAVHEQIAVVTMGAAGNRSFDVLDIVPIGDGPDATMLILSPR